MKNIFCQTEKRDGRAPTLQKTQRYPAGTTLWNLILTDHSKCFLKSLSKSMQSLVCFVFFLPAFSFFFVFSKVF